MEIALRAALLDWLRSGPTLSTLLNAVEEESPLAATPPWLGIAASASTDWSTKDRQGREVRVALELVARGDDPAGTIALGQAIEARIESLPRAQDGFDIVTSQFLRARAERRERNLRAVLLEYRFRVLAT
ncbi:MAG: DUF3168 domain-containing protein [Sphingomonadales bacterium]|nr:DUF3168 domain-containing protein [Sphingomonadales bacterium]MBD3773776.1 DUF3168 domain-containing protein [Paracoccaceae bacterium]